jgi:hypothetical protein
MKAESATWSALVPEAEVTGAAQSQNDEAY